MNLGELIAAHKSGRSYEELARDCGGVLTSQRLQQIATTVPKAFPNADTLRGLARGLRVSESVVVLAVAESLGLDVSRAVPRLVELLPASAMSITDRQAAAVAEVIRSFTETREGDGVDRDAAPTRTHPVYPDLVIYDPKTGEQRAVEVKAVPASMPSGFDQPELTQLVLVHRDGIAGAVGQEFQRIGAKVPEKIVQVAVRKALDADQHPELYEDVAARESTE